MKYLSMFIMFAFIIGNGVYADKDVRLETAPTGETPELVPLTDDDTRLDADMARAVEIYTDLMWAAYCSTRSPNSHKSQNAYNALIKKLESDDAFSKNKALSKSDISFIYAQRAELRFSAWQNPNGAKEDAKTAIELDPESVNAAWILGKMLTNIYYSRYVSNMERDRNKEDEMFTALKRVVELDPDHNRAHDYIGRMGTLFNRPELAITSFKALTRIMPFRAEYHNELGKLYEAQNRQQEALHSYERVLTISPDNIDAHYNVGVAYQRKNNFEKAEYHIKRAVTLLEEHVSTMRTERMRSRDRIRLARHLQEIRYQLAQVYLRFKAPQKAAQSFEKILTNDGNYVPALIGIGIAYQMLNDIQRSENYLRKAIELSSAEEVPDAYNALGYLYAEQGIKLDEAETLVQRALKSAPTSGAYLDSLGLIYLKQGKLDAAIKNLEQAVRYLPDEPEILGHLADAYLKKGLEQKALQTLEHAVQIEPDNDELRQKLAIIKLGK